MNRPRNRQPRGGQSQRGHPASARRSPATPQQSAGSVPSAARVLPGVAVRIVLKEDQPTGNETRGVVQDVLTRGNHPRGIKVRLQDGQVGRVQSLDGTNSAAVGSAAMGGMATGSGARRAATVSAPTYTDVRNDGFAEGPPPRSLADFMPDLGASDAVDEVVENQATAKCPFCDAFEGDEAAVTHHIDKTHLT